ncbi:MAG: HAD family hydrolase [Bryobacterales bacterium]|nr:HAD family hydrolase [Bryobacterales bacterium]
MQPPSGTLVLFDIDGTLVRRAGPHHREALEAAVASVTGLRASVDGIPVHGMLDRDIVSQMLRREGVAAKRIARWMPSIEAAAERVYLRTVPDLRSRTCPGAVPLLRRLQRTGVPLAIVSGNLTRIGWAKLARAGMGKYFRFGAFSQMAPDRAGLARLAIRHARKRGWIAPDARVSLVGDAPSDILAAKANGIQAVAVTTGISTPEELASHAPDLLLDDLGRLELGRLLG